MCKCMICYKVILVIIGRSRSDHNYRYVLPKSCVFWIGTLFVSLITNIMHISIYFTHISYIYTKHTINTYYTFIKMEEECGLKKPCVADEKCATCHRVIMRTTCIKKIYKDIASTQI